MDDENIISRYTRENAIDDGVLVDVTEQAKETGIRVPTVITSHLHQVLEDIPETSAGQDYRGRLHDVLWMTFLKLKAMQSSRSDDFPVQLDVIIDGQKQTLWAFVDGDGLTIMFPEDY
jgi:hypothetical protein